MSVPQTDHKAQGIRLKNRRKALNLSANDLALELQALGQRVSRGAIANWECGKNGIIASKLPALAKVLQCSESYLLTGEGDLLDMMHNELVDNAKGDSSHLSNNSKTVENKHNGVNHTNHQSIVTKQEKSSNTPTQEQSKSLEKAKNTQSNHFVQSSKNKQSPNTLRGKLGQLIENLSDSQLSDNLLFNKSQKAESIISYNEVNNEVSLDSLKSKAIIDESEPANVTSVTPNPLKPKKIPVPILSLDDLRADLVRTPSLGEMDSLTISTQYTANSQIESNQIELTPFENTKTENDILFNESLIHHILQSSDMLMTTPTLKKSKKLANVCYDIRGPLLQAANQMEAEGQKIIKLNIGNPAPFGLFAPEEIIQDVASNLHNSEGYSDSRGIFSARKAILQYYQSKGLLTATDVNDVYIGNGVSELIVMAMQALLDDGDEVLIPMPDYPLWTAATNLAGGKAVHYRCDEENDWQPNLADMASKITDKTKAIVIINPNNPTGAVYGNHILQEIAKLATKHNLVLMADEIYDRILYDGATHTPMCTIAHDCLVLSFNGLSKSHRIAGFRSGWLMLSGKKDHAHDFIEGLTMLASMRLCANVPAQHAIQTAMGGHQSIETLTAENGRLNKQRVLAYNRLNAIKGLSCTLPKGALYFFVKIDLSVYPIDNDMEFMMDLLKEEKVLMVQGTGFNWDKPDHFRVVFLPNVLDLEEAMDRLERFFAKKRLQFGTE